MDITQEHKEHIVRIITEINQLLLDAHEQTNTLRRHILLSRAHKELQILQQPQRWEVCKEQYPVTEHQDMYNAFDSITEYMQRYT